MTSDSTITSAEAELESFRRKWREEVTTKAKGRAPRLPTHIPATSSRTTARVPERDSPDTGPSIPAHQSSPELVGRTTSWQYSDLAKKQHGQRLDEASGQATAASDDRTESSSALEYYEQAVEKECQGRLGDSVNLYRKAFRLDAQVHETYKAKHFPSSSSSTKEPLRDTTRSALPSSDALRPTTKALHPDLSNASPTVSGTAHSSLQGLSGSLQALISQYSNLSITGEPPPTDLSPLPPCPMSRMPEEILVEILEQLAVRDLASFVRLARVCKRLTYLVATEDRVWKRIALGHEYGFATMHYTWACQIDGKPLGDDDKGGFILGSSNESIPKSSPSPSSAALTSRLVPSIYPNYRTLFNLRPRIRFNGCYISTVNYTRPGQASPTSVSWNSPIHIVTYYRYLRFFRDGTCISLLTISEPADIVPALWIEHLSSTTGPMKDAVLGRWRLTGPDAIPVTTNPGDAGEKEGTVIIETRGATPKYMNKMALRFASAGRMAKNNKLAWQGYWSYNLLTDDWGEFFLKNDRDRAFYWSRVKSYGMAWDEGGAVK